MKKIKGSLVKSCVIPARANKTGIYQKILTEQGKDLLKQRIFDSIWYSHDAYKELFNAVCKVEANNNKKIIIEWGKKFGEITMTSIYRGSIVEGSIEKALNKYARFHKMVYTIGTIKYEILSENHIIIAYADFDPEWENFYYLALGWLKKYLELCVGKQISHKIIKKSWEGAKDTTYEFTW
ncbi:MAG: hypothetical protein ACFFAS_03865 [Promethearchaeota archaeon]